MAKNNKDEQEFQIMEIDFFDTDFYDFILRYGYNLVIAIVLLQFIYKSDKKNKNYAFTYYVFNTLIFFLC